MKKLYLVHGEYDVQTEFAEKLIQKGFDVEIPGMNYAVDLFLRSCLNIFNKNYKKA
ncbi:MAG: MBL fold metallo-hydrolase RNA specificity domain-containing protein [Segetibacter sp.]